MAKILNYLKENSVLIFIIVLSAVLRIYHLDYQSLWIDEINTMVQARPDQSFMDTYRSIQTLDLQPPLYFYILKYMFCILGYTSFVLRLFSGLLGIAGIGAIYLLGKELFNKKAGIYAALLLSVNAFHIYYSQEGRPYAFLFLFTTLSFYFLLRFIKKPSYKGALYYGVLASLMLYGHPYGLFTFLSQYIILGYFFFKSDKSIKFSLLKQILLSGVVTITLYIPSIPLLLSAAAVNSFWIPKPGPEVFTDIFKDFFGNSELLLSMIYILIIFFFVKTFEEKESEYLKKDLEVSSMKRAFFVLIIWLIITIMVPLIRSYMTIPMIISRYLIGVLPAIIIMISIGITQIRQKLIRVMILLLILIFSFTELFVIKRYYKVKTKSQFKEVANFIKENYNSNDLIISHIAWHYSYYLDKSHYNVIHLNPDSTIDKMIKNPKTIKPFWFADGHDAAFENLSEDKKQFLKNNFFIIHNIKLQDAWAIYFIPINEKKVHTLNLEAFMPIHSENGGQLFLYKTDSTLSKPLFLDKGNYELFLEGKSEPSPALNNINAHITVKINDKIIGGVYLSELYSTTKSLDFTIFESGEFRVNFSFDNDIAIGDKDRNAFISSVFIINK